MKKITTIILICAISSLNVNNKSFAQYTTLLNFAGTADGSAPYGSVISDGTFLYGMTNNGGTNNKGVVFKIKHDGTGYAKLRDFGNTGEGKQPKGDLISDGTFLYGMTETGGTNNLGTIFKIKPDGTGYFDLYGFTGTNGGGSKPKGSLISVGNFLYGMTNLVNGTIFKINQDGTGFSNLHAFGNITDDGENPDGSLIFDGTFLYGMTANGGANNTTNGGSGTIFKIKPDGTGYAKLYDFACNPFGCLPHGSLISIGNFLYGMTSNGGANATGTLFKVMNDGTGYTKLLDFGPNFGSNGSIPYGSLIFDGTFLYGMTTVGGTLGCSTGCGIIFKIKPDGTAYSKIYDFDANGNHPYGSLFSDGTSLYGMTVNGGTNNLGTIFNYHDVGMSVSENTTAIDFNIYPNPNKGTFTIEMSATLKHVQHDISVYNVLGENIYQLVINSQKSEIDLSKQTKGIYFLQVIDKNKNVFNKKIIIQ